MAHEIGYPCSCAPSYVLGGRGMEWSTTRPPLKPTWRTRRRSAQPSRADRQTPRRGRRQIDVDALFDGRGSLRGGGRRHRGGRDPLPATPRRAAAHHARPDVVERVRAAAEAIARGVGMKGLINLQFARLGRAVRDRGRPARLAHRCRSSLQGHGRADGQGRRADRHGRTVAQLRAEGVLPRTTTAPRCRGRAHGGQGGRAAVHRFRTPGGRPWWTRFSVRCAPQARSWAWTSLLRHRVRQGAGRRGQCRCPPRDPCSSRWRTSAPR
ncbi:hypothetical protein QJS66_03900 [Kocuria rhizophila]|nr:hypothetical protein QJS66_03900 [Kocuria rhizophila]